MSNAHAHETEYNKLQISADEDVKDIVIRYKDGREQVLDKGFAGFMSEEDGNRANLHMQFVGYTGDDLKWLLYAMMQLAADILLPGLSEDDDE